MSGVHSKQPVRWEACEIERAFHPLADAFLLIDGDEFAALVEDVRANGVREPVVLYDDKILDGRNRWRAAREARVGVPFIDYGGDDPVGFVISANLRRRHLNESQRALVAAKLANISHGGDRSKSPIGDLKQRDAAALLHVGKRSVERAVEVRDHAAPELQRAVERGDVSVAAAADVAELPYGEQQDLVARGEKAILEAAKKIRAEKSEARRAERMGRIVAIAAGNGPLPTGRSYPLILADPPWRYLMGDTDRSVENHYPTMALEDICALPVARLAAGDAVLFLWIPEPHLFCSGAPVLQAWGFTHKSGFIWDKQRIGMGHYNRVVHEHLLICTRGAVPEPRPAARPCSLYSECRSDRHSQKPQKFYEFIEAMYPEFVQVPPAPPLMIELFARSGRPGWASWGNQAPKDQAA